MSEPARVAFDQWRELFIAALGGAAADPHGPAAKEIVEQAEEIADRAVLLIRQRAGKADAEDES
jgi:truncated hemoglobin YjbI